MNLCKILYPVPSSDGVTLFDGPEAGPAPTGLIAVTVKGYVTPLVSPLTIGLEDPISVIPPGLEVTV